MAMLVWAMMGLAIWHFTIFLPDRFWGGIVGAFLGALFGAILIGLIVNGFKVPGEARHRHRRRARGGPRRHRRDRARLLRRRTPGQRSGLAAQQRARGLERGAAVAQRVGDAERSSCSPATARATWARRYASCARR